MLGEAARTVLMSLALLAALESTGLARPYLFQVNSPLVETTSFLHFISPLSPIPATDMT